MSLGTKNKKEYPLSSRTLQDVTEVQCVGLVADIALTS